MNLVTIESEIWWIARADDIRPVKGLTIHKFIKALRESFNFASVPVALPAEGQPFVFKEGFLEHDGNSIPIKLLENYIDGTHIKVNSSDDADIVFQKFREVAIALGVKQNVKPLLTYHVSAVTIELDNSINNYIRHFSNLSNLLSEHLDVRAAVNVQNISLSADPAQLPPLTSKLNPTAFRLETRLGTGPHERRYFSVAHMTTSNHLKVLGAVNTMLQETD